MRTINSFRSSKIKLYILLYSLYMVYPIAPIYHTGNTPVLFASTKCNITILYNWETVHNPILLKTLPPTLNQLLKAHIIQSHVHLTYTSANY